jgi:hypothetical protein
MAPWQSPTRACLHGAATTVVRVLPVTTAPKRAVAGDGSGSTYSGEQRHPTAHLLTEGLVSGGPTGRLQPERCMDPARPELNDISLMARRQLVVTMVRLERAARVVPQDPSTRRVDPPQPVVVATGSSHRGESRNLLLHLLYRSHLLLFSSTLI